MRFFRCGDRAGWRRRREEEVYFRRRSPAAAIGVPSPIFIVVRILLVLLLACWRVFVVGALPGRGGGTRRTLRLCVKLAVRSVTVRKQKVFHQRHIHTQCWCPVLCSLLLRWLLLCWLLPVVVVVVAVVVVGMFFLLLSFFLATA